ncbi:MAG: glycosyltransferase family 4 protein, partial [Chitinophagaceae bacterium]|nr:glycosyltransferase family 4 protein [Chitinophagaceae bacterium]
MNYWLLTTEFPPFYGGGISTYCYFTTQMLAEKGHQVTVFVSDPSISRDVVTVSDNIRVIRFGLNKTGVGEVLGYQAFLSYEFAHTLNEYLAKEGKPDIIEIQDYQGIGYYTHLRKQLQYDNFKDLTILTTLHVTAYLCFKYNRDPIFKLPTFWMGEMEKFSILSSDIVISPSHYIIGKLGEDFRLTDKSITVVPNPIKVKEQELKPAFKRNDFVFFGKMVHLKGGFHLIDFFKTLWDQGFKHSLKIIGETDFVLHTDDIIARDLIKEKYGKYIESGLL